MYVKNAQIFQVGKEEVLPMNFEILSGKYGRKHILFELIGNEFHLR